MKSPETRLIPTTSRTKLTHRNKYINELVYKAQQNSPCPITIITYFYVSIRRFNRILCDIMTYKRVNELFFCEKT